jgi:UPF0716 protein FxsA
MRWLSLAGVLVLVTLVLEVVAFVLVARWLGVAWALAIVIATCVLGGILLRREGVRGWRRFRAALEAGRPPGRDVAAGLVGLVGALLLAVPGLLTDVIGLVLLLPPVRWSAGAMAQRLAERRMPPELAGGIFGPRRVKVRQGPVRSATPPPDPAPGVAPGPALEGEIVPPPRTATPKPAPTKSAPPPG